MRILVRPVPVAFLLIACHLGAPGRATAEPSALAVDDEQRAIPDGPEDTGQWRPDSAIGLAGDLDPLSVPEKQIEPGEGSERIRVTIPSATARELVAPATSEPSAAPSPLAPPAPAKPSVQSYEVEDNHYVRQFVDQYQTGYRRVIVESWLARSGRYLPMILDVFRQKGLPDDLVFTAMIESGFNPTAVSRAGAKGLWQFMAPTARQYGLRVDRWVDERLDPEKSTVAAARYLRDLYATFGSWELAKAAYNAGEMKVLRAMSALGSRDFWDLTRGQVLRDETKNFVPAIQAATVIGREPERYGFSASQSGPIPYEVAPVPQGMQLATVAALAGVSVDTLRELNPELSRKQTPPGGSYNLKFPIGTSQRFMDARYRDHKVVDVKRGKPDIHVVRSRETMGSIARRYGISATSLARWNDLDERARLRPGDRLRLTAAAN